MPCVPDGKNEMSGQTKRVEFTIQYPPTKKGKTAWNKRFGLNAYWSGKHYRARAQDAKDIHSLVWLSLKKSKVKKEQFKVPVEIAFYWDDMMDIDNHAALGKMIVDSLKGYLLKDDSPKWYRKVTHEFWNGGCIKVIIQEENE